ncbi:alpha-ketoglutarate-dependent dioxygenase alkB homolog 6 isoform X2 [Ricinus communis]|uniref:alpha-ketoglutarate-dependent dioxygenase alkB homolog 6 isoform X2 n=1 Tax=Ricinus communis TaxID=3988 RepID=UPI00201A6DF1|nr:alpha-ketoglutarate-dependent dioxygenase alkB homolog 6 isoform X2 [Ricinus communis]
MPLFVMQPHQDGPAYFPVVAILSLGSPVVMDFIPHSRLRASADTVTNNGENKRADEEALEIEKDKWTDNNHPFSLLLMPRSLLIFKDNAYSDYLHGIKDGQLHHYDKAINDTEALVSNKADQTFASEKAVQIMENDTNKVIYRTRNRVSLTCRTVLKVHKNLFKF